MSHKSNLSNRRLIMSAELLSMYQRNTQLSNQLIDVDKQRTEQDVTLLSEQSYEQEDNAIYVLGYN